MTRDTFRTDRGRRIGAKGRIAILVIAALLMPSSAALGRTADPNPVALAKRHENRGEFKLAASILRAAYEVSDRPQYLLMAAHAEQRAVMLDAAEAGLNELLLHRRARKAEKSTAKVRLLEIRQMRQALAAARIDARRQAARAARQFDAWQAIRDARERAQSTPAEETARTTATRKHEMRDLRAKTGLMALTLSGAMLVGKALLASEQGNDNERTMMLIAGGVLAGIGGALLAVRPGGSDGETKSEP